MIDELIQKGDCMKYENNENVPFRGFITNLGKYTEGELVGRWIDFPTTKEKLADVLSQIGIGSKRDDGSLYEEVFITDYECNIPGLERGLGEYSNIDELNHLATLIDNLDDVYSDTLYAAFETEYSGNTAVAINLVENVERGAYSLLENVKDEYDMGKYLISESGENIPEWLESYIDYESYGSDKAINGSFTSNGYIEAQTELKDDYYKGYDDIPVEERVTDINNDKSVEIELDVPEEAPRM